MNRRNALGAMVGTGAGMACGIAAAADGHPAAPAGTAGGPLAHPHLHFCGIHVAKTDPKFQLVTQHYCAPCGADMHQCLLYESRGKHSRLLGVEYIVSDQVYRGLPEAERRYWHPHTYEVMAGGLIAPGLAPADEDAFMTGLLTTWGKTWHTWPDPATPVPMGEPLLMWSLGADGQEDPAVVAARDREFGVSTAAIRKHRAEVIGYEVPRVPFPKSAAEAGRQWTPAGDDTPTKR